MNFLKQSTAIKVRVGPFVDVGDGFIPETGITLSGADEAELLKANGAATVDISGATWAAITGADGWYDLSLTASHTDTVGELVVVVQDDSVCLPVFARFQVVEEAVYDAMYGASAAGPLQSTTAGRTLDVTAGGTAGIDWGNVENPTTAVDLSGTDIQLCDTVTANTDMRGTDSAALASVCTETRLSELDAATAGKMANQVDEIRTDTGEIGAAGAGLTEAGGDGDHLTEAGGTGDHLTSVASPADAASPAEVAAEISDALSVDTYAEPSSVPAATATLADKIGWLVAVARNKLTFNKSTGAGVVRNDADSGNIASNTSSDDGTTVTRGEWS